MSFLGHAKDGTIFVLSHQVLWGSPLDPEVWEELDKVLRQQWRHPAGGSLKVDAAGIDAGDGGVMDEVLRFCTPRLGRKVLAVKGAAGFARPAIQRSKIKTRLPLFIAGVDSIKSQIFARLGRGNSIRFSHSLDATYYEMLASERRVVRMTRGRPVARFERKLGARAESLDCLTYGLAARAGLSLTEAAFVQRADALAAPTPPKQNPTVIHSEWMQRGRG
jgi:phage terminase large subunit GpA-like protein